VAWAEAYLRTKWHLDPYSRLATTDMGRKLGEALPLGGGARYALNTMLPGRAYLRTKWHLDPSSRLATTYMGRKFGGSVPFLGEGELGPHLTQCCLGQVLPP